LNDASRSRKKSFSKKISETNFEFSRCNAPRFPLAREFDFSRRFPRVRRVVVRKCLFFQGKIDTRALGIIAARRRAKSLTSQRRSQTTAEESLGQRVVATRGARNAT
jgi:hypothetical protein